LPLGASDGGRASF
jgi:hypothetical protein